MRWNRKEFLDDDFFEITRKYFSLNFRYYNPAQIAPKSLDHVENFFSDYYKNIDVIPYHNDDTHSGIQLREILSHIINKIDKQQLSKECITLTPTITNASLIVLRYLQEIGINSIYIETPCYYATLFQVLGTKLECKAIPTYFNNNFLWSIDDIDWSKRLSIWITHPKISLGIRQEKEFLLSICKRLKQVGGFLIVDEATELKHPSLLSLPVFQEYEDNIIRLRSVFKAFGINGPRVAMIIHSKTNSRGIKKWVWTYQGGIDGFSINVGISLQDNTQNYNDLLHSTYREANENFGSISRLVRHSKVMIPNYGDGYTSSFILKISDTPLKRSEYLKKRKKLIQLLEKRSIFPTLGASMYFAYDGTHEFLRINYLSDMRKLRSLACDLPDITSLVYEF